MKMRSVCQQITLQQKALSSLVSREPVAATVSPFREGLYSAAIMGQPCPRKLNLLRLLYFPGHLFSQATLQISTSWSMQFLPGMMQPEFHLDDRDL